MNLFLGALLAFVVVPSPSPTPKWALTAPSVHAIPFEIQGNGNVILWADQLGNIHGSGARFDKQMAHFRQMCLGVVSTPFVLKVESMKINVRGDRAELECNLRDNQGNSLTELYVDITRKDLVI